MKVTVNIDCTPEEARVFFGLPDVKPLQKAMMAEMEKRMKTGLTAQDMELLMKAWMPQGLGGGASSAMGGGMEQFQKMFWNTFMDRSATRDETAKSDEKS